MRNLIRRIWVCNVFLCPTKRMLGIYGLKRDTSNRKHLYTKHTVLSWWCPVGAQCLSSRGLDSRPRDWGLEPHPCHCLVSLSKNIDPSLILVKPRKTNPFITERLLMGRKESNQTNKTNWWCPANFYWNISNRIWASEASWAYAQIKSYTCIGFPFHYVYREHGHGRRKRYLYYMALSVSHSSGPNTLMNSQPHCHKDHFPEVPGYMCHGCKCILKNKYHILHYKCTCPYKHTLSSLSGNRTEHYMNLWPPDIKLFSCSTQLSTKFQLLIKSKRLKIKEFSCFQPVKCFIYHANKC